uniref:Uncharacterized protein n=1 Tax=Glossina austeni TaxID=7395 RepID=A0A1A9VFH3_GLOAU
MASLYICHIAGLLLSSFSSSISSSVNILSTNVSPNYFSSQSEVSSIFNWQSKSPSESPVLSCFISPPSNASKLSPGIATSLFGTSIVGAVVADVTAMIFVGDPLNFAL